MSDKIPMDAEWLEPDGLGGFASGTVSGARTRRYHALLLSAVSPPTGRFVLVNGFDARVETTAGAWALSSQVYSPDVVHPDGARRIVEFSHEPWPRWLYRLEDGTLVSQEIVAIKGSRTVAVRWKRVSRGAGGARLVVRPFVSGRDYHSTHHENDAFRFEPQRMGSRLVWRPYDGVPAIVSDSNGSYEHDPAWYRNFLYRAERARGLDDVEDLASPGSLIWDLEQGDAVWILSMEEAAPSPLDVDTLLTRERRRREALGSALDRGADAFLVRRGEGRTIIAGYPWFTDWGRDTFIAIRGLCLATGRLEEARSILVEWASTVSEGMLPNLFPDGSATPEYNSVDASLWYIIAVEDTLAALEAAGRKVSPRDRAALRSAVEAILEGYSGGTRFGIRMDSDGLLAAGEPGVQLTWMDAKIGDRVITPRVGKPVEVQALWLNALAIGARFAARWQDSLARGMHAFTSRFWNEDSGCLYDVVDVDHRPGTMDASLRPNQVMALGGLPLALVEGARARRALQQVEDRLWTPMGLRSLAPGEPGYSGRYAGGPSERDAVYHQGTVWPWLIGPFVEAWVRSRGRTPEAKKEARRRYLAPLLAHLTEAGLGSVSEIADADPPHTPRGCPFQAWSLGEVVRVDRVILGDAR